jgi:hypothetical protein
MGRRGFGGHSSTPSSKQGCSPTREAGLSEGGVSEVSPALVPKLYITLWRDLAGLEEGLAGLDGILRVDNNFRLKSCC